MIHWQKYQGEPLVLKKGAVHIWYLWLPDYIAQVDRLSGVLSDEELKSAARFIDAKDAVNYKVTKALQRQILSNYAPISPEQWVFKRGEHGKPFVANDQNVQFNLSHAGDAVLIAVTKDAHVGIDIEKVKKQVNYSALIDRFFSEDEKLWFKQIPENEQNAAFYNLWVGKEAFVKATGDGLTFPLSGFSLKKIKEKSQYKLNVHSKKTKSAGWDVQFVHLPVSGQDYYAALAMQGKIECLQCWQL